MIKKVEEKMQKHVEMLLEKPIITNEEFMLLKVYLERLEAVESKEKWEEESKERDKKFQALMATFSGGGLK